VLSASYHPENEGAWKWSADKADRAKADKAKADKAKAKTARFDELEAKITGELAELRQELRKKDESEREMKAMLEKLLNLHGASVTG
jgi:septin family protein